MTEYVYIMESRRRPDLCKVGRTSTSPSRRCEQLNKSEYFGVTDWSVAHSRKVSDSTAAEAEAHRALKHYRAYHKKHREAFAVDFNQARRAVDSACAGHDGTYDNLDLGSGDGEGIVIVGAFIIIMLMAYGIYSFISWAFEPSIPTVSPEFSMAYDNANEKYGNAPDINDIYDTVYKKYEEIWLPKRLDYKKLPKNYDVLEHFKQVIEYVKTDDYRLHSNIHVIGGFTPFFENYFPHSYIPKERDNAEYEAERISWDDLREMFRITRAIPAEYVYANFIAYSRLNDLIRSKQRDGYSDHYDARNASPAWARDVFFTPSLGKKRTHYFYLSQEVRKERRALSYLEYNADMDGLKKESDKLRKEKDEYFKKELERLLNK